MQDDNTDVPGTLPENVALALQRGQKIEAIKLLRLARGIGLKEAKDCIDQHVAGDPTLARKLAAARAETGRGCLLWVVALAAAALLAYWLVKM